MELRQVPPEVVIATLMRRRGASGVQTHTETFERHLQSTQTPVAYLNSFSFPSPLVRPLYGARYAIEPLSGAAGVWWYRRWHEYYLRRALSRHLAASTNPVVIYAQCPVSALAGLRARRHEPVVMVVHFNLSQADEWAHDKGLIREGGRLYRSIRAFEASVLPRLDGIVYVSNFMKAVVEEQVPRVRQVPSAVIPNFIEILPAPASPAVRDVITVGALEVRKNQAYLLDIVAAAARRGHRYTVTIVGEGPDRARLESRAASLGLRDQVKFTGHVDDPRSLMAQHRLCCHTSRMESFGIVLIEAMSAGVPVLAVPVGGVVDIVEPGVNGEFWSLGDAQAAATQLVHVLETPGLAARMGAAGYRRVEDCYSTKVVGNQLKDFLSQSVIRRQASG